MNYSEVLTFRLGSDEYGIDILSVQEIRSFETSARIAKAKSQVLGVLSLSSGRRIKYLTVVDVFSKESVDITADYSTPRKNVTRVLDQVERFRGYQAAARTENDLEFTSRAYLAWMHKKRIRHILIEPGKPKKNGYIASFSDKFRNKCVNEQWFESPSQARACIAHWRQDYNKVRPHSSLGRVPPTRFAQQHRQRAGGAAGCKQKQSCDHLQPRTSPIRWFDK